MLVTWRKHATLKVIFLIIKFLQSHKAAKNKPPQKKILEAVIRNI